jgi:hypothetical protein
MVFKNLEKTQSHETFAEQELDQFCDDYFKNDTEVENYLKKNISLQTMIDNK